jgi:hypothetical protein
MSYIFRLHEQGDNTLTDWSESANYGSDVINQIKDPDGHTAAKEITSIPSPFARIDLVKTAFKFVVDSGNLKGKTIYHKMVSDALDVAEIFFNYDRFKDKVEILKWDKNVELDNLKNGQDAHKSVFNTLSTFFNQDSKSYNFDYADCFYLLRYKGKHKVSKLDIIGATSPATLFFSSANDLSYLSDDFHFSNDKPFDGGYVPLYERDKDFVGCFFALKEQYQLFSIRFPEVSKYLDATYNQLDSTIKDEVDNADISNYDKLSYDEANEVSILKDFFFFKKRESLSNINKSDFIIKSNKNDLKPLVLPVKEGTLYESWIYSQGTWGTDKKAPYYEQKSLKERVLPFDGTKYPYLTISDFLEDTIIAVDYEFNSSQFYDFIPQDKHNEATKDRTYLCPLKSSFFDYFTTDELLNDNMLTIEPLSGGGLFVRLTIPVQNGKNVIYEKNYFVKSEVDRENNRGNIVMRDFSLAMFPNVKFSQPELAYYSIGLMTRFNDQPHYSLKCYNDEIGLIDVKSEYVRNQSVKEVVQCKNIAIEKANIDYIVVNCAGSNGLILPKFKEQSGSDTYSFAIDFGTTNTHIEYNVNGGSSKSFDITENDLQLSFLSKYERERKEVFYSDFIPEVIGIDDSEFKFPIRTVLSEANGINWKSAISPLVHANIPFTYEKRIPYKYNKVTSNLKWSNNINNISQVRCYIESLMLLLRNKVLLNGGDLADTKIIWFYPISMTNARFYEFKMVWLESYKKYFDADYDDDKTSIKKVIPMTESIAPYKYYNANIAAAANMVTIDIGGETTDVVIAENNEIKCITSFRFAANSVFGDGYTGVDSKQNGIIRQFKSGIYEVLKDNNLSELKDIFDSLDNKNISADIASFLFSLVENQSVKNKEISDRVDFNKILRVGNTQNIVILIFYTAIIYHVASIMKAKKLCMPRYFTFSGNGSKIVTILTLDMGKNGVLSHYTRYIFSKIFNKPFHSDGLGIEIAKNPKIATCKGGLSQPEEQTPLGVKNLKIILKSTDNNTFVLDEDYKLIKDNKNEYIKKTVEQVKVFFEFLFSLNSEFNFKEYFGIEHNSFNLAKDICNKDLETYVNRGLDYKLKEVAPEDKVEETMFFYAISGVMHALADEICNQNSVNPNN